MPRRTPLSRERIVAAAASVADASGLAAVSMRSVGRELDVEAMSLYHHVANKDHLLDALADWVFAHIELPTPGTPWREAMTVRASSARTVLAAHPWGLGLIESRRTPGPALLTHHDTVIACLLADGFEMRLAMHAFSVLDAYIYGFVLVESTLPMQEGESPEAFVEAFEGLFTDYPHLGAMYAEQVKGQAYDYGDEFTFGLELVLDGLEVARSRNNGAGTARGDLRTR